MRALLIVPPFGGLDRPSLGVHTLQSCARRRGHEVDVFYANIAFAARLGEIPYMTVTTFGATTLLGERIMGLPAGAHLPDDLLMRLNHEIAKAAAVRGLDVAPLTREALGLATDAWLGDVASKLAGAPYRLVGLSTTFEQTNGLALLARHCRALLPRATLIAGGANCEDRMASAIKRYVPEIDVVFSGESEAAFTRYLDRPEDFADQAIIASPPNSDLDDIPPLDYREFFEQLDERLPDSSLRASGDIRLPYESSRGCWWGQKHHCTFCGLNGSGMGYREKDPERVVAELAALTRASGIRRIGMTDNIMPFSYFNSLIPRLAESGLDLDLFYEQKANISLDKVLALKAAGVNRIQPGIEALQDELLRLMRKGTGTKQNVALLRYCRAAGVTVDWNLLTGFPGEREEWYAETSRLLPLISHLEPPSGIHRLSFDRFSPYFEDPERFGISGLRPYEAYAEAFPGCDRLDELAYHFVGDCADRMAEDGDGLARLRDMVESWRQRWEFPDGDGGAPCLEVVEIGADTYLLIDTRPLPGTIFMQQISTEQAAAALSFHPEDGPATRWAESRSVCFRSKDGFIPLACATPAVTRRFERLRVPDLRDAPV